VYCQLETLRKCLKPSVLLRALEELPSTLDATYERILLQIPEQYHYDAQIVFSLLAFSARPISLGEAAEAVAIDLDQQVFDPGNRLSDPRRVLKICSTLIAVSQFAIKRHEWDPVELAKDDESKELRFAHYSIKEYLLSERAPATFHLTDVDAHDMIARLSLTYILSSPSVLPLEYETALPFFHYASTHWHFHSKTIQRGHHSSTCTITLILLLFSAAHEIRLRNSARVSPDGPLYDELGNDAHIFVSVLYYASAFGLVAVCEQVMAGADVNAPGGYFGYALQAASSDGNKAVVRLLLDNGADVNAQGGNYGNALQAASSDGNEAVVRLLLENGADVNAQGGALQAASCSGNEAVVLLLLENGADVNAQGGAYGNALRAASWSGNKAVVRLLLDSGAEPVRGVQ
jgi:hypothetical protein